MRCGKPTMVFAAGLLWAFGLTGDAFSGMGGFNIDLAVRQVTVTPVRAYVGDKVRVEVLIENRGEGSATTNAEIYANGKLAGRQLFTWGWSPGERFYRLTFEWDTRGTPPGEYKLLGAANLREDTSPSDNRLEVQQPVVLAPSGGTFPGGATAGGSATETDPRFKQK